MIKLKEIGVSLSKQVILEAINFSFADRGLYIIIGNNGSGKTTLLKTMCGIYKPTLGLVQYQNKDIHQLNHFERSTMISYTDNPFPLPAFINLTDYIQLGLDNQDDVEGVLDAIKIGHLRNKPVLEMSRGQQQKAMLAKLFYQDNPIWLMDEPTNYLDYPSILNFWEQIQKKAKEKLIICTIHNPEEAIKQDAQILILKNKSLHPLNNKVGLSEIIGHLTE